MNIAPRANFQISVETLNLNQFSKFHICMKEVYIFELHDLITNFFVKIYRFDVLSWVLSFIFKSGTLFWLKVWCVAGT